MRYCCYMDRLLLPVLNQISQSWWVLVSTSKKFLSLNESRSWHPRNFSVLMSLGLDIQEISQSLWVSVSTSKKFPSFVESRSWHQQNIIPPPTNGSQISARVSMESRYRHLLPSLVDLLSKERPNKRNLTKLDKFNQNQLIYLTKFAFYSIK